MNDVELGQMKLHEEIQVCTNLFVRRVLGGWIYRQEYEIAGGHFACNQVFVPFPNSN